jgi:putative RNA 2'-phosphotransferase
MISADENRIRGNRGASMDKQLTSISKFLSLILRHQPEAIGLRLDPHGWARIDELMAAAETHGSSFDEDLLLRVVHENDKQRFTISPDGLYIRANQGHSIEVDLQLHRRPPPPELYHGTVARFLESIRKQGLLKGVRQYVHLSSDRRTARTVGARRGTPIVLTVRSGELHERGDSFSLSANGVWLIDHVPAEFLIFPDDCPTV